MTKQSENAKAFIIGQDLDDEQKRHPIMGKSKEFRILLREDDPVRYENREEGKTDIKG